MVRKGQFDPSAFLKNVDKLNVNALGKRASINKASIFTGVKINEATSRPFGSRLTRRLKKSKELDFI